MIPIPNDNFAGFIFDCDGTLAHSIEVHYRAWTESLQAHGATFDYTWELFRSMGGMSIVEQIKVLEKQFDHTFDIPKLLEDQEIIVENHFNEIRANQGVVDTARHVAKTHPVSVASGGHKEHVHRTLEVIGADDIFDIVVTSEDVAQSKPAPDLFLLAAKKMGVNPTQCLVFEDTQIGIEAARAAGMQYILVTEEP